MGLRQTHRCLSFIIKSKVRDRKSSVQSVDFECDREVIVAIIATAERERNKRRFTHKNSGRILFKNVFKNVSKNSRVISRSYTHGGEKIKQTVHAPVPAALELRRAVVAKVKAHDYSCARKRCGSSILVFLLSDDDLLPPLRCVSLLFLCRVATTHRRKNVSTLLSFVLQEYSEKE